MPKSPSAARWSTCPGMPSWHCSTCLHLKFCSGQNRGKKWLKPSVPVVEHVLIGSGNKWKIVHEHWWIEEVNICAMCSSTLLCCECTSERSSVKIAASVEIVASISNLLPNSTQKCHPLFVSGSREAVGDCLFDVCLLNCSQTDCCATYLLCTAKMRLQSRRK